MSRLNWRVLAPLAGLIVLAAAWGRALPSVLSVLIAVVLAAAVLAAVHHAEVVAHRVGEPLGSLVLAVAVTVIEVGLIVALMVSGGPGPSSSPRRSWPSPRSPRSSCTPRSSPRRRGATGTSSCR